MDEFPWFQTITEAIVRELRMASHFGRAAFRMRPILLAGTAGTGKSRYIHRLAQLVEVPHMTISCAGSTDSMSLRGTSRGWSSARPGSIIELVHRSGVPNPIVCLDELEKSATTRQNGRIWDVLLQLLERETSQRYFDECLEVSCDLSWVSFIGTVNALGPLPEPLRQRFLILHAPAPSQEHFLPLLDGILADIAQEYDIGDVRLLPEIVHEERQALLEACGINPRLLTRAIHRLLEHKIQTSAPILN
jgi:MoxR-like ATPase